MRERLQALIDVFIDSDEYKARDIVDYLLANGVIVPPVWVNNIVWFYVPHRNKPFELRKGRVSTVEYTLSMKPLLTIRYNDNTLDFAKEYWGNRAFATESEARTAMEEAENALKERERV